MSERKVVGASVNAFVEELKKNPSNRFSKADFQMLVYAILSDREFNAKKYLSRGDQLLEDEYSISGSMLKFMDKLLKHAGFDSSAERSNIIDSFEFGARDIEWVIDAVDEAMYQYSECGKNMRMFRDKMLQLTVKKIQRSGKYEGKATYKKVVVDRALAIQKRATTKK